MALTPDQFVPQDHPIRGMGVIVEGALAALSADVDAMYVRDGRPSILPERLFKGSLLVALHSIRSEGQLLRPEKPGRMCIPPASSRALLTSRPPSSGWATGPWPTTWTNRGPCVALEA